ECALEGEVGGRAPPPLPRPDAKGTIPYIARIQAVKFSPGRYEIRAEFGAAGQRVEERDSFRVAGAGAGRSPPPPGARPPPPPRPRLRPRPDDRAPTEGRTTTSMKKARVLPL